MCSVSKDRIFCTLLCAMCIAGANRVCAQGVYFPILEKSEATPSYEPYRISFSTSSRAVTVSFPMGGPLEFNLRAEYFRTSSLPKVVERAMDIKADWKFKSIPITASYTYAFPSPSSRIVPVAGIGVSAHFYRESRRVDATTGLPVHLATSSPVAFANSSAMHKLGLKVGAEASLGLRTQLGRHMFVLTEARYRYVNCSVDSFEMYGAPPLNQLDFNLSIGFAL